MPPKRAHRKAKPTPSTSVRPAPLVIAETDVHLALVDERLDTLVERVEALERHRDLLLHHLAELEIQVRAMLTPPSEPPAA